MMLSKCGGKCCLEVPQEHSQPLYVVNILERLAGVWQDSADFIYLSWCLNRSQTRVNNNMTMLLAQQMWHAFRLSYGCMRAE